MSFVIRARACGITSWCQQTLPILHYGLPVRSHLVGLFELDSLTPIISIMLQYPLDEHTNVLGNAWVAAGIVRTLATIENSKFSGKFKSQKTDLTNWASEVQDGFYSRVVCAFSSIHDLPVSCSSSYEWFSPCLSL